MLEKIVIPKRLLIDIRDYRAIVADCEKALPNEACGLIAGYRLDGGESLVSGRIYPAVNEERSPTAYRVRPEDQLKVLLDIENEGMDPIGIYHSHPEGLACPSQTDIDQAFYPEAVYVIVGMRGGLAVKVYCLLNPKCFGDINRQRRFLSGVTESVAIEVEMVMIGSKEE